MNISITTLADMWTELEAALRTVDGLRVGKWGEKPTPPGAYLLLPESIEPMTYRGPVRLNDVQVVVIVGKASTRQALTDVMRLTGLVPAALDGGNYTSMADVTVDRLEYDTVTIAGAPDVYLALIVHLTIAGA